MIHAQGLTREFRVGKETVQAVRGLDLDVREGELVAFLGPNGAGKSTSLRMLTTLLVPTSGTATVAGHDVINGAGARPPRDRLRGPGPRRRRRPAGPRRDRRPGPGLRRVVEGRGRPRRRADRVARAGRRRRAQGRHAVGRPAPPARHRDRAWSTRRGCCSSTSRRPASTRRAGPTCGTTSGACATGTGPRSSSRPTTSRRPTRWPSACSSSTPGGSSPTAPPSGSRPRRRATS